MQITNCSCGRVHNCAVEQVYNGGGTLSVLQTLVSKHEKVLVIADENTYEAFAVAGGNLEGLDYNTLFFPATPMLVPDEKAIAAIKHSISPDTSAIIGIGGGTINDLCKHIAHSYNLYYIYIATAPSMDGYASDGAALILDGMKVTLKARPPHIIICDTELLCNAPIELIRAGVGDILGKFSCLNDWLLAKEIKGEFFCKEIYDRVYNCAVQVSENAARIMNREKDAVKLLADALINVGIEMSYAGSSRPASGSEHHMAHFFEIHALEQGHLHRPHGIDVGCAAYFTALLREKVLNASKAPNFDFRSGTYFETVESLLPRAYTGIKELQSRVGLHGNSDGNYSREKINAVLRQAPTAEETKAMLAAAELHPETLFDFYGKETVQNALKYGKELKDRFTVLWLYEYLGWEILEL